LVAYLKGCSDNRWMTDESELLDAPASRHVSSATWRRPLRGRAYAPLGDWLERFEKSAPGRFLGKSVDRRFHEQLVRVRGACGAFRLSALCGWLSCHRWRHQRSDRCAD